MQLTNMENYIFDLDGTLIDTAPRILECINLVLYKRNIQIDVQHLSKNLIGPPLKEIVKSLIKNNDEELINNIIGEFRALYNSDPVTHTKKYKPAADLLDSLSSQHKKLFIATNKPYIPTVKLLKHHFTTDFNAIYTPDCQPGISLSKTEMINDLIKQYGLNKQETVLLGDTEYDLAAAQQNDIKFCFAEYGYGQDKELLSASAEYILKKEAEK